MESLNEKPWYKGMKPVKSETAANEALKMQEETQAPIVMSYRAGDYTERFILARTKAEKEFIESANKLDRILSILQFIAATLGGILFLHLLWLVMRLVELLTK